MSHPTQFRGGKLPAQTTGNGGDTGDASPESKACTGCGIVKALDEFSFDRRHADGRQSRCRACFNAHKKVYREADPERYLELKRLEYERNRAQYRAYAAAHREANRELLNQRARDRVASLSDEERAELRRRHRERSAAYRDRNPDVCAERIRVWKRANPDKVADTLNRRRARKFGNGESEKFARTEIGERDRWICGICAHPIDKNLRFPNQQSPSLDHIIPLVRGGTHTRANTRITHWICNVRRGADREMTSPAA